MTTKIVTKYSQIADSQPYSSALSTRTRVVRCTAYFSGGSASPAPSVVTTPPTPGALGFAERASRTQNFQDTSLRVAGGNGVAVAALGLLGVLTFLPVCSK